jgi:hypothetical protein
MQEPPEPKAVIAIVDDEVYNSYIVAEISASASQAKARQ